MDMFSFLSHPLMLFEETERYTRNTRLVSTFHLSFTDGFIDPKETLGMPYC